MDIVVYYNKKVSLWIYTSTYPDHLTCLLRNLYAGQEATVRTGHETKDRFQIGKGVRQGCILSPCLFNLYEDSTRGHHQMVNSDIRLIIFFAAKDGEARYSQQKQDQKLTVAQIMNSLLPNSDLN